jgi:hypothetical protein
MSQIGDLTVRIGADPSGLTRGMDQAKASVQGFEASASKLTGVLKGLFAAFTVQQFTQFIRGTINAADEMGKLSQKVGIGTEELSKLQYAADLAGISSGELTSSLSRLTKGMSDATQGTGEALKGFQALGINVKNADGTLRSSSDVMGDVADAFAGMEDGAGKTALAISIFGRAGANLIPLLNGGRQAIKDAGDELERFGGVVTPDAARKAEIFNDNLTRLQTVVKGVGISIANDLLPFLTRLSEEFLVAEKNALTFFDKLSLGLRSPFKNYQQILRDIDQELADLGDKNSLRFNAERAASLERQRAYYREMVQIQALAGATEEYSDAVSRRFMRPEAKQKAPTITDDKLAEAERQKLEDQLKAVQKSLMTETQILQAEYDERLKILEQAKAKGLEIEGGYDKAVQDLRLQHQQKLWEIEANSPDALAAQKAAEKVLALEKSLTDERTLLIEDYEIKAQMLRDKYMLDGEITAEGQAYLETLEKQHQEKLTALTEAESQKRIRAEQAAQNAIFSARAGVVSASIGLLNAFAGKSKAAALAAVALNKALAIAQIIQNTAAAQMRAMAELGPIAGPPVAASIGVMGKVQAGIVAATGLLEAAGAAGGGGGANIASTGPTSGGVNTGIGMAGSAAGAAFGGGQVVNINLTGEVFGREQVRGLIGQINEAISDGAVLRVQ